MKNTAQESRSIPIRVVAAVIARGKDFLVCQRSHDKNYAGLWEFPGGKCEPNESIASAARRELREELGVDVTNVGAEEFSIADPSSTSVIVFAPVRIEGDPSCREHIGLQWVQLSELIKLPLAPADRQYVEFRLAHKLRRGQE